MPPSGKLVYSSDTGRLDGVCPRCRKEPCACQDQGATPAPQRAVRVERSRRGRSGKTVTLVSGIHLPAAELSVLAATCAKTAPLEAYPQKGLSSCRATSVRRLPSFCAPGVTGWCWRGG